MEVNQIQKQLKVFSIIALVSAILNVLLAIFFFVLGGAASTDATIDQSAVKIFNYTGLFVLVSALFGICEWYTVKNVSKDISKYKPAFIVTIISIILSIMNAIQAFTNTTSNKTSSIVGSIIGVCLNVYMFYLVNQAKNHYTGNQL